MGNCEKLKWNRKKLRLTQKQFAEAVGLSLSTICRLECDETAWQTMRDETVDRISDYCSSNDLWPIKTDREETLETVNDEQIDMVEIDEEPVELLSLPVSRGLTKQDDKTLTLIEFVYEGLQSATTHEDFVANINMIKRIVKEY